MRSWGAGQAVEAVEKKKIGTQIDPNLHRRLKVLSAVTGRRIDSLIEEAIRKLAAEMPVGDYVTFEQMHAEYERRHGVRIDIAAEAARLEARNRKTTRRRG